MDYWRTVPPLEIAIRIALLTRTCGISPAATAWYTVDGLTRRIAASSRTVTHRTDPESIPFGCTKDVPSGRESAANRCEDHPIPAPDDEYVAEILLRVVRRTAKALVAFDVDLNREPDALDALQAAEVERRLRHPDPFRPPQRAAFLDGFSLHAGVRIHANDREGRDRLCRYVLRPPLALHRLSRAEDGRLLYRMKRPRGGSCWLALTEDELLAKLATLVPPPRVHSVRYHGVFAPHAGLRSRVVPGGLSAHPAGPPPPAPAPPC